MGMTELRKKYRKVAKILGQAHVSRVVQEDLPPLDHAIFYLIAIEASPTAAKKAFRTLKDEFVDWNEIRVTPPREIQAALTVANVPPETSVRIRNFLGELFRERSVINMDFVLEEAEDRIRKTLARMPALPPWTAAYLLSVFRATGSVPDDPHTRRILTRVGLLGRRFTDQRIQKTLDAITPESDLLDYHALLLEHGRKVCTEEDPKCIRCPLSKDCDFFRKAKRKTPAAGRSGTETARRRPATRRPAKRGSASRTA